MVLNPLFEDSLMASQTLWLASPSHNPGMIGVLLRILSAHKLWILKSENQKDYVHGFNLKYSNKENKIQNLTADSSFNFEKTWTDGRIAPVLRIQNLWAESIFNKTPIIPGLCEGLASHKVCEAIRESSKSGLRIKI